MQLAQLPKFRIDFREYVKGSNSFPNYPDGGFDSNYFGMNAYETPGYLTTAPTAAVATSGLSTSPVVAYGLAPASTGLGAKVMALGTNASTHGILQKVSDSGAYTVMATDTARNYGRLGFCDVEYYNGAWFYTSRTDMGRSDIDLTTPVHNWWTATMLQPGLDSFSPHPLVVFSNILYIADKNFLHQLDGAVATGNVFDLPTGWVITDLAVYNNLLYISAEPYFNASGQYHGQGKIFTWDGFSPSWLNEYNVDVRIDTMFVFENVLYCFTPYFLGYFDGRKVRYLRPLSNHVYRSMVTETLNSMVYADGADLIRFGAPVPNTRKSFVRYINAASVGVTQISGVLAHYQKTVNFAIESATTGIAYTIPDFNAAGNAGSSFQMPMNRRAFTQQVKIRAIVIEMDPLFHAQQSIDLAYIDDQGLRVVPKIISFTANGAIARFAADVKSQRATRSIKPAFTIASDFRLRFADFYYEASETPLNK